MFKCSSLVYTAQLSVGIIVHVLFLYQEVTFATV